MIETPSHCDFAYASVLKTEISSLFQKDKEVKINLSNTERMSLACVQVLIAACNKSKNESKELKIIQSDAVTKILEELGVSDMIVLNKEDE